MLYSYLWSEKMGQMDFCTDGWVIRWTEAECQAGVWPENLSEEPLVSSSSSEALPSPQLPGHQWLLCKGQDQLGLLSPNPTIPQP